MSEIRANSITDAAGTGAPNFPNGLEIAGEATLSAIASQAEAEAGTSNTVLMTPLRTSQAIAALASSGLQDIDIRTETGSFIVPAGVTELFVLASGGGGGGGAGQTVQGGSTSGGPGGVGGFAASKLTVTPGQTISYTVGAGGAGSNTGNGAAGGTTTVDTISCTGGGGGLSGSNPSPRGGADGVGSGGTLTNAASSRLASAVISMLPLGNSIVVNGTGIATQVAIRPGGAALTGAIAYSVTGTNLVGAGGTGETEGSTANASGGVGGAVIFIY